MFEWIKKQFGLGWSKSDTVRATWTFVGVFLVTFGGTVSGAVKAFLTSCQAGACEVEPLTAAGLAAAGAALSAAFLAVKNFVLKDRSALKG